MEHRLELTSGRDACQKITYAPFPATPKHTYKGLVVDDKYYDIPGPGRGGFGVVLGVRATISGTYRFVGSRTKRLIAGLGFWMSVLGL